MAFRFRKSIRLTKGVKVNIGKKSVGVSVGNKYGGVSTNSATGTQVRASLPGTGITQTKKIKNAPAKSKKTKRSKIKDFEEIAAEYGAEGIPKKERPRREKPVRQGMRKDVVIIIIVVVAVLLIRFLLRAFLGIGFILGGLL